MTLVASCTNIFLKLDPGELFSSILKNISIIFAHDLNSEKCLESLKISSKIFLSSSLGVLGICILSLVWLKPIDLQISASFFFCFLSLLDSFAHQFQSKYLILTKNRPFFDMKKKSLNSKPIFHVSLVSWKDISL